MKWLFLLRGFFPSWRFFDDAGPELVLQARARHPTNGWGPWENALPPVPRGIRGFPLNAQAGYLHACHNSLEHLTMDLNRQPHAPDKLASYKIIKAMALFQLRQTRDPLAINGFQFKILVDQPGAPGADFVQSPEYSV